ncbi:hypothetical protein LCGC14_3107590 [marine sediment metagenome]|uniref:Uncharacterized protein n=1 Tax=marine sediment metagenome TaxID=412755 RepID=A0A0F8W6D0_9ZZZZ
MSPSFPFIRWRGKLNMKDVVERVIAGGITGVVMGAVFFALERLIG